ncbi:MAG: OmpA family protein [Paracoccaceae bacterium]
MRLCRAIAVAIAGLVPLAAAAQVLEFPSSAVLVAQRGSDVTPTRFAVGPFKDGEVTFAQVDRTRQSQVWKIREPSLSTSQIAAGLRVQLAEKGYQSLLDCEDEDCGGYDFRYALDLVAEPVMHVDLGDFRYISARRGDTGDYLSLMISRSATGGIVQLDFLGDATSDSAPVVVVAAQSDPAPATANGATGDVAQTLATVGRLSLEDLTFATGSSELSEGVYPSLARLAAYLLANPDKTVALVGHTDAEGSLAGNIALSQRRAASVLERLVSVYGVPRRQMEAEGVGYLAPRMSNLTEEGRRKNRRVEVILTSTQ